MPQKKKSDRKVKIVNRNWEMKEKSIECAVSPYSEEQTGTRCS